MVKDVNTIDVHIVGAGPGDVDLITVKGRKLLEKADVIIYAGSLVSDKHLDFAKDGCQFYNSAKMNLDEVLKVIKDAKEKNLKTVRLHTGDPSIYGAIKEQMDAMDKLGITYEVIPGVSSFTAACASLKEEFTLPSVSQTVILTRMKGRTSVPEDENIRALASIKASMAIFLSVGMMDELIEELISGYGSKDTPCAVVYKATWEDEIILRGTLKDIGQKVKDAGITSTAQILVGDFLDSEYELSKLYDKNFTTMFRKGEE